MGFLAVNRLGFSFESRGRSYNVCVSNKTFSLTFRSSWSVGSLLVLNKFIGVIGINMLFVVVCFDAMDDSWIPSITLLNLYFRSRVQTLVLRGNRSVSLSVRTYTMLTSFGGDGTALTLSIRSSCGGGWLAQLIRSIESRVPTPHQFSLFRRFIQGLTCCFIALDAPSWAPNRRPSKSLNNWICDLSAPNT